MLYTQSPQDINTGHHLDQVHAVVLALIQGVTEFLPISSSAHLVLPSILLGWEDQGLAFDTAVHFGSLIAVIIYFRGDLQQLMQATIDHLFRGQPSKNSQLALNLFIASLPIIPVGFFARFYIEASFRVVEVIAFTTIFFALALWLSDYLRQEKNHVMTPMKSLAIGLAQCLALIPGTSRSGVTITMALLVGYSRREAARFSFLISIPAIAGAACIKLNDMTTEQVREDWATLLLAISVAGISAYFCIALLLSVIARIGYLPFVIYRLLLGFCLFWLIR